MWGEELDAGVGRSEGKSLEAAESTRSWKYPKLGGSPLSSHPLKSQMGTLTPKTGRELLRAAQLLGDRAGLGSTEPVLSSLYWDLLSRCWGTMAFAR